MTRRSRTPREGDETLGDIVELSHLVTPLEQVVAAERAARRGDVAIYAARFVVEGERLTVRWEETWGGPRSRELACGDVERVDVEGDDRSAATGRPTWKVVVRLRGGEVIVPVRRGERAVCEKEVAKLERLLGLAAAPTVLPTPAECLPGGQYVSMVESGAGMRPIVEGRATLVGAGEEGGVLIRLGEGPPWLLVGADRARFWARAVGVPAEWGGDRELGREWQGSGIARVRDVPVARDEPGGGPGWSGVWVEMRDGTRVRVARRLAEGEALAVAAALGRALALPTRWGASRAYLDERVAETLGPRGGVSGDGPAETAAAIGRSVRPSGAIVLPYAREPAHAVRIVRGDGVLRVSVPPVAFWRGWIRQAVAWLPVAGIAALALLFMGHAGAVDPVTAGVAAWAVMPLWLGGSALVSRGARTELVVADGTVVVEHRGLFGRRKRRWPLEDVLSVREGRFPWTVTALVREPTADGQLTRTERRLLTWDVEAERRRLVEVLRAAVGLDLDAE